jgi:transposase
MKLCASRAFWLVAYPSQGHEMLFDAHTRSFAALGGVARRGIYDNMRTASLPRAIERCERSTRKELRLQLCTAGDLNAGSRPWVQVQLAGWVKIESSRTTVASAGAAYEG